MVTYESKFDILFNFFSGWKQLLGNQIFHKNNYFVDIL